MDLVSDESGIGTFMDCIRVQHLSVTVPLEYWVDKSVCRRDGCRGKEKGVRGSGPFFV